MKNRKLTTAAVILATSLLCTFLAKADSWQEYVSSNDSWVGSVDLPACSVHQFAGSLGGYSGGSPSVTFAGTGYSTGTWTVGTTTLTISAGIGGGSATANGPLGDLSGNSHSFSADGSAAAGTYSVYVEVVGSGYASVEAAW